MFKKILLAGFILLLSAMFGVVAFADVTTPTLTYVYFEQNDEAYDGDVEYEVDCYGYESYWWDEEYTEMVPGGYIPYEVFSYSASCPEYGCEIYESYYMNYRSIDYCDATIETDEGEYFMKNYASEPVTDCEYALQYDMYDGDHYYVHTEESEACLWDATYDVCMEYMDIVDSNDLVLDESGYPVDRVCSITFDLDEAIFTSDEEPFSDISTYSYEDAVLYVKANGIVDGYADGTYKPDDAINRAEFTKIIVETLGAFYSGDVDCYNFTDVPANTWYDAYVCNANAVGLIEGYDDGSFQPANYINFAEAAKLLSLAFSLDTDWGGAVWYEKYVKALQDVNAIPTSIYSLDQYITRGEMAEMIYRLNEGVETESSAELLWELSQNKLTNLVSREHQSGTVTQSRNPQCSTATSVVSLNRNSPISALSDVLSWTSYFATVL